MKIKKIKEIRPEEVEVEWENGEVETLKGTDALTLLLMTDMKAEEEYQISLLLSSSDRSYFYAKVYKITEEGVIFVNDDNEQILIEYKKIKSLKPIFVAKGLLKRNCHKKQTTAKERVEQEFADLEERYEKLDNFVGNARYMELPYAQKYLLVKQLAVMEEYEHILKARLDCWKD